MEKRCETLFADQLPGREAPDEEESIEPSRNQQIELIEEMALPQSIRDALLENNNSEIYSVLGVDKFQDYVAGYIAGCITNGIGYIISFLIAILIIKVILYAVDILTGLPVINFVNAVGGMLLGIVQALLWIWIFFIVITVLCNTLPGQIVMEQIDSSEILKTLYDKNLLMNVILQVIQG